MKNLKRETCNLKQIMIRVAPALKKIRLARVRPVSQVLICVFSFASVSAQVVRFSSKPRFLIELNTIYDDNIFLYSPRYLDDFKNQRRSYRFPFETTDDFIVQLRPSLSIPLRIKSFKPSLFLSYKQYLYTVNTEKSYQIFSVTADHSIIKPLKLSISYLYLPRYLIRYYRNPLGSSTDYIGCTFNEQLATAQLVYQVNKNRFKPFLRYEIDNYKKNFNYYDGYAWRFGINTSLRYLNFMTVSLNFERKLNYAQGPVPDISYNENKLSVSITPKIMPSKLSLNVGIDYAERTFTTDNSFENDPYHCDRVDRKLTTNLELTYPISRNLKIYAGYEFEFRKVKTPNQIDIEEIKEYNNIRYTLGLRLNPEEFIQ